MVGENSKIEWCDHTFNPWTGCTKVSAACDNCYAESWAKSSGQVEWGPHAERRRTSSDYWRQAIKWNKRAEREGRRYRVFCASLADVFDNQVSARWRDDLWHYIDQTPHLDWLLLTKRPQNIAKMLPDPRTGTPVWGAGWRNVWLGTTAENQEEADRRIPHLLSVPAAKWFLSCEPLLGPLDIRRFMPSVDVPYKGDRLFLIRRALGIQWVITGGESGPNARPMHPDWARSLRDQCQAAGVPFFFKQWGEFLPDRPLDHAARRGIMLRADGGVPTEDDMPAIAKGAFDFSSFQHLSMVGKKKAGAMLDGREWRETP